MICQQLAHDTGLLPQEEGPIVSAWSIPLSAATMASGAAVVVSFGRRARRDRVESFHKRGHAGQ